MGCIIKWPLVVVKVGWFARSCRWVPVQHSVRSCWLTQAHYIFQYQAALNIGNLGAHIPTNLLWRPPHHAPAWPSARLVWSMSSFRGSTHRCADHCWNTSRPCEVRSRCRWRRKSPATSFLLLSTGHAWRIVVKNGWCFMVFHHGKSRFNHEAMVF